MNEGPESFITSAFIDFRERFMSLAFFFVVFFFPSDKTVHIKE